MYIPTHVRGPEIQQDPVRLSNAVKEAARQLDSAGLKNRDIETLLEEARARTGEAPFWKYQGRGLAVFVDETDARWVKLPETPPELTVVAGRFHVRPLIPILRDEDRFHVLAVTRNEASLYDARKRDIIRVEVEGMPAGIEEIRQRTDFEADLGFHHRDRGKQVGGADRPKFDALGESPDDYEDVLLEQYIKQVAKAVDRHLAAASAPLVLAAKPRELGRLRQELTYRNVAEKDIQKDPPALGEGELHRAAWAIAEPLLDPRRENALKSLRARHATGAAPGSEDLQELLRAASEGRVEAVFLDPDQTIWGRWDEERQRMERSDEADPGNEDLLNLLAVKTLGQGGEVFSLPEDLREQTRPVSGVFRY
jgi:protein required for attachment to host cells